MNQDKYISLIIKQLSEKLSIEEEKLLNEWISSDNANCAIKDKLVASWNKANHYKEEISLNEKEAWNKISSQLSDEKTEANGPTPTKTIPIWKRPLSIAASLLFLMASSWFFISDTDIKPVNYSTAANETLAITLPDGSLINLNENSQLAYIKENGQRNVDLSGEAYFDVSHNVSQPFIVKSNNTTTKVLGTEFNINSRSNNLTEVSLFKGKVSFTGADQNLILLPGDMVKYSAAENKIEKHYIENKNTIAWKTKELKFTNDKLENVVKTLATYFDKKIELKLNGHSCVFTSNFKNPDYNEVIDVLKFTYNLNIESNNNSDVINIKDCK